MGINGRRLIIWGLLLVVLAAGIAYALRPQPVPVDFAVSERGVLRVTIDDEGETRVREVYTLFAPLAGRLYRIAAEAGDPVEANVTELARIEPAPPPFLDVRTEAERQAAVEAALAARDLSAAELDRAQADLVFATREVERARQLLRNETITRRAAEDAERGYRVGRANVATATAALKMREYELMQARSRLLSRQEIAQRGGFCECVPVSAPVSGQVLNVIRKSEGVVDAGTALLEIGDTRDLEIVVDLLSEDAVRIAPGQKAVVTGWGGADLPAVVRLIEPLGRTKVSALGIEEQRVDVMLDFTDPPDRWRQLGHGYRVNIRIILFEAEVLHVPLGAMFRDGEGWAVFLDEGGRARRRSVTIGQRNTLSVEIRDGLSAGQRVVLYPSDRIADGTAIVAR